MEGTRSRRQAAIPAEDKKFACTAAGCTKRFTRAEHLQRHALNHTVGESTCPRCSAHFKRPDLLDRHMNRHRQKDLEAGGEGCGQLDTRKRAWKAADGSVVERRPHPKERAAAAADGAAGERPEQQQPQLQQQLQQQLQLQEQSQPQPQPQPPQTDPLLFPTSPVSDRESELSLRYDDQTQTLPLQTQPSHPLLDPLLLLPDDPWQLWSEQPFQPDTASSFNMPYTTALDYNWLFNMSSPGFRYDGQSLPPQQPPPQQAPPPPQQQPQQQPQPPQTHTPQQLSQPFVLTPRSNSTANVGNSHDSQSWAGSTAASHDGTDEHMAFSPLHFPMQPHAQQPHSQPHSPHPLYAQPRDNERPLSLLEHGAPLPSLDRVTHHRLLTLIARAHPVLPDTGPTALNEHPLLSQTAMQSYLDAFFLHFNAAYPIIHLPLFDPAKTEPLLLLATILLGATYAAKDAHQVAVCIHDVIRPLLFAHDEFSARPELWTLQTILLVECFGKSRAGQKQHDMSHLFHGLLINLIRRSDCQSVRPPGPPPTTRDHPNVPVGPALERAWRKWAEAEQKKRLALYCFMWDTQHAVLFCQSLCMSAFELRLHFPCHQTVWEARDAASWAAAWWMAHPMLPGQHGQPVQPFYLPTLRAYLVPGGPPAPPHLGGHARLLILHGLMSVCWDMQRRDQTSLGAAVATVPGGLAWREMMASAYGTWKTDFEAYCGHTPDPERTTFAAAANAVYHAAQCLLRMDFLDVQIYAGARHILGRPVQQRDYLRSAQVVKRWAAVGVSGVSGPGSGPGPGLGSTPGSMHEDHVPAHVPLAADAAGAAWHAARMLRDVVPEADAEAMAGLFHVPWCLYLATLTCWAFHHAAPPRLALPVHDYDRMTDDNDLDDADEIVWDAHAEMDALLSAMAVSPEAAQSTRVRQGRRQVNGLVWVMADMLTKVRWGIVHAGVRVLRGLVPTRLINQYEAYEAED